ncbi:Uncharacterised protein [Bordetella pertussis]|nr:Uncharacterised protein [Bordetella pertussis]
MGTHHIWQWSSRVCRPKPGDLRSKSARSAPDISHCVGSVPMLV